MNTDWKKFVVTHKESIRNTMEVINESSSQIALVVVDEYRLVGAVTDGRKSGITFQQLRVVFLMDC